MKKSLFKDSIREIRKTVSRFLAILSIVLISVAFFTGIKITCPDMKHTADVYYNTNNLMDFRVVSTIGFNDEDIKFLGEIGEIKGISPSFTVDALLDLKETNSVIRVHSLVEKDKRNGDDYINRPMLIEGRFPKKSGECVIEKSGFFSIDININSLVKLKSGDESNELDSLKTDTYKVVGVIKSPLYVSKDRGTSNVGAGKISSFIYIDESDFDLPVYNTVYLTVKNADNLKAYTTKYDDHIKAVSKILEEFAEKRAKARFEKIKLDANNIISEKQAEYERAVIEADTKFADAKKTIDDNEKTLLNGEKLLLENIKKFYDSINNSQAQLDGAKSNVLAGFAEYEKALSDFNLKKQQAIDAGVYETQKQFFIQGQAKLDQTKATLDTTLNDLNTNQYKLDETKVKTLKTFDLKKQEIITGKAKIATASNDMGKAKKEADQKLIDGSNEISKARNDILSIPEVKWHILGRNTNAGYVDYGGAADRMNAIAQVFPLIFILVGILICFTAMGRMVDEQRGLIGTLKALGYSKTSIAAKYLLYAALASIIGGAIGVFIGFSLFPSFIFKAFSALYTMPALILVFDVPFAVISINTAVLVTTCAALIVCFQELQISAAQLMRPKAPKPGKTILLEKIPPLWKKMSFTQKVTARNLLRYKSRFFMTVIGVMGCTALLLVGFGLQDSIGSIGIRQFRDIFKYQMVVGLQDGINQEEITAIKKTIEKDTHFSDQHMFLSKSITIGFKNEEKNCGLLVPESITKFPEFISLRERTSQENLLLGEGGVILTEKLAKTIGATDGSVIYIKTTDYDKRSVKVTGICENYLNHYLYMSPNLYENVYKEKPQFRSIYVNLKDINTSDEENISKSVLEMKGVGAVFISSDMLLRFKDTIKSVNYVVLILIISAGLLSFIVLYTLTNININERMREIATIKVLGFYDKEVAAYVFKENIILTFIGGAAGLVFGYYLSMFVIQTAEVDVIMFGRQIYPLSFAFSLILTLFFALFVNVVMLRKIRKINMVEALKTVE